MSDQESQSVPFEAMQLPPMLQHPISRLGVEAKKLLREKTPDGKKVYADPEQLQKFLALNLIPLMQQIVEILGAVATDTYNLTASNMTEVQRLRKWVVEELELEEGGMPGVSHELLTEFSQAFYALGTLLKERVPDPEIESAYNAVSQSFVKIVGALSGGAPEDEDEDDDDDEGDDEGEEDEGEGEAGDGAQPDEEPE